MKPKDYDQFERATELCEQISRECPKVSVILNCNIQIGRFAKRKTDFLFGILPHNSLTKDKKALIVSDGSRKFIVFTDNVIHGKQEDKK